MVATAAARLRELLLRAQRDDVLGETHLPLLIPLLNSSGCLALLSAGLSLLGSAWLCLALLCLARCGPVSRCWPAQWLRRTRRRHTPLARGVERRCSDLGSDLSASPVVVLLYAPPPTHVLAAASCFSCSCWRGAS